MQVNNLPNLSVAAPRSAGKISSQSISGGKTLGSGVVDSAANNIVGFKKAGTSAVAPKVPNISSLLQTISSNIISSVENISGDVKNVIQGGITNVKNVFGKKEREEDPNKIMSEFLGLYKKALDYVKFFADPKQLRGFDKAIKLYQDSLKSTGDTVVTIRKFIKKMIKDFLKLKNQLSSMGGGGGGFALPLPIPGRGNKPRPRPRARTRMPRGRGGKLGLGLLGLGLLGSGAMAAQKFVGGNEEKRQTATGISEEIVAKFDSVLQKFDQAVSNLESLISGSGEGEDGDGKPKKSKRSKSLSGAKGDPNIKLGSPEEARIAAALITEGGGGTAATDVLQVAANRVAAPGYGDNLTDVFAQPGQFQGVYDRGLDNYRNIESISDAAKFAGVSEAVVKRYIVDMRNEEFRENSKKFVGGALEFRGSPRTVRAVNSDSNPNNNIEEVGTTGIIPGSIHRGGDGDNQYLTGSGDSMLSVPATIDYEGMRPKSSPYSVPEGQMGPVIEPKPDKVSSLTPQAASYVSQVPGSNNVAMVQLPSESKPAQRSSVPPPATKPSTVQNIDFSLPVHNPDNSQVIFTHQMLNVSV